MSAGGESRTIGTIRPFAIDIPQAELDALRERLAKTRWPERETVDDWTQGVPLERARELIRYWETRYDWRRCEAALNALPQYLVEIDGLDIYFLHVRSPEPDAFPLILSHGWPGSVIEFLKVIGPLTDPAAHGGDPGDAFHLVIPSLPGYGFSGKPTGTGWGIERTAAAWHALMLGLGYPRYVAQGGDWGAGITTAMGAQAPPGLAGIHLNLPLVVPPRYLAAPEDAPADLDEDQRRALADLAERSRWDAGYALQQTSRPQTIGYALADSPAGQAMWIYEKFWKWTDSNGDPESVLSRDEMLDNIMLYWLPNAAASSARMYWESSYTIFGQKRIEIPVGCSIFPGETYQAPRRWADESYADIIHWRAVEKGGHFAAFEQPGIFAGELRDCFRNLR